jgi:fibronectin-binding autotransporter adhesin
LNLTGASTITAATMGNSGHVFVGSGATLSLTSQPTGITDAVAGSQFDLWGAFTAGGSNGFAQLNSIEGTVNLFGQSFTDTPGSGTLAISSTGSLTANARTALTIAGNVNNSGYVDMENSSTFQVNGNATNSGHIYTSFSGTGGNTFNITGTLNNSNFIGLESTDTATIGGAVTNSGSFQLTGGATATFTSTLMNTGTLDLENASTLKIKGAADNFGTLSTSAHGGTGGNALTVSGLLTNEATGQLSVNGPSDVLQAAAGLVNKGLVTVKGGSKVEPPFVNNLGTINIDDTSTFLVGTGSVTGPGFIQLANGTFGEMINSATAFGQVNVAGSASLNGTLDILL